MRLLLCATAVVAPVACAIAPRVPHEGEPVPVATDSGAQGYPSPVSGASLSVENNTTFDVRIFVLHANMPLRLGEVPGMSTVQFELKPIMIRRDIRLYATPIGASGRVRTDALLIRPGQLVMLALDNKLRSYRLSVY